MKLRSTLAAALLVLMIPILGACDLGTTYTATPSAVLTTTTAPSEITPQPAENTPTSALPALEMQTPTLIAQAAPVSGTPTDQAQATLPTTPETNDASPTPVTATSTGTEMTALQALATLGPKAVAWQPDARLGLLANTRPAQQKNLLGGALGDPNVNEPTPGGKGRGWTLVAVSPSTQGAVAVSEDGTQVDLVKSGSVTPDVVAQFTGSGTEALDLSKLDTSKLVDSDKIAATAASRGTIGDVGVALLSPSGLGLGPLPTPKAGGASPQIAYEVFVESTTQQSFVFFDATTGAVVLDSSAP